MMTRSTIGSLLLLGLAASQVCVCQATISDTTSLRAGGSNQKKGFRVANDGDNKEEREFKRQSVIRRLYGAENGEVRKHVRLLEEKSDRSRTGFMGDPYHEVPYENHPYQETYDRRRQERQRHLQDTEFVQGVITTDGVTTTTTGGTDLFKPLRIRFETQALDDTRDAQNAAKIDFIKTKILPA